ncbi:hypothetical protein MMPV_005336 [Pyropia vietnamensis]
MAAFLAPPGVVVGAARPPQVCGAPRRHTAPVILASGVSDEQRVAAIGASAAVTTTSGASARPLPTPSGSTQPVGSPPPSGGRSVWQRLVHRAGVAAAAAALGFHVASGGRITFPVGGGGGGSGNGGGGNALSLRPAAAVAAEPDRTTVVADEADAVPSAVADAPQGRTVRVVPPPSLRGSGFAGVAFQQIDLSKLGIKYDDLINDQVLMSDKTVSYNEAEMEIMELEDLQELDGWRQGLKLGMSLGVSATGLAILYKGGVLWERWIKEQEKKDMEDEIELTGTFIAPSAVRLAEEEEAAAKKKKKRKDKQNKDKDGGEGDSPKPTTG